MITVNRSGPYPIARCTTDKDRQCIIGIGDIHVGAATFNESALRKVVKYAVDNDALVFFVGDMIENANKRSIGAGVYEQVLPPRDQLKLVRERLQPIKRENIIGGVIGNHEDRTMKDCGFDPMMLLCDLLDVPYFGKELFAVITKERASAYSLYAVHSLQSSKTKGLVNNSIERDWFKWIDCDIIAKGHGHDMGLDGPYLSLSVDKIGGTVTTKERYVLLTGNYLERPNSYASQVPFGPKPSGTVAVWLDMRQHCKKITGEEIR